MTRIGKVLRGVVNVAKRIALGGGDIIPLNLTANRAASEGGEGKFDYLRLATSVIILVLVVGFLFGKMTMEQLQNILELLK
ncbi:hypothetical protein LCGC14_0579340 [marine sediment metagenome]|uniref:Uncharacterized protein n=1 Tax=marine sediment metagenome TaxID=412755 RepID=A0A0F9RLV2_9ZZZZ